MGMVGGGIGAFIGEVHRKAAFLDGHIELVCGAFSSNPQKCIDSGKELYLPEDRCYSSYQEMFEKEALLPEGERMDFVAIVTPNHVHYPVAKLALENGFHVMSDKPATLNVGEAKELAELTEKTGLLYGLTHAYTGYPMVKEARQMIADGKIGKIRKVVVEYPQGWLATSLEESGQKQADWRTNPKTAGISCCMGDIGSHCESLLEYITGLEISEICADLTAFVDGRTLDDDGNVLIRMNNGAKGLLHASQISVGEENDLNIRIYGETGGLRWRQMEPNTLYLTDLEKPEQKLRAGTGYLSDIANHNTRLPAGHPEGLLAAFGNLYRNFA
ncbi:MAG: Gfo/Idh/MocA family oxidoreductase, partial [Lentisphaeraceae bacterium]|nr:Gfo/Idh/MocA family oxidoreductase [Lentisphaeraceae bacterium]